MGQLIIREVFKTKPGQASKFAKLMKEAFAADPASADSKWRVMTDFVGEYNTVVVETEAGSLAEFEKRMEEYMASTPDEMKAKMSGYTEMYMEGRREIWRVVE